MDEHLAAWQIAEFILGCLDAWPVTGVELTGIGSWKNVRATKKSVGVGRRSVYKGSDPGDQKTDKSHWLNWTEGALLN